MEFPTISDLILQELQKLLLEVMFEPTRPYTSNMTVDEKVKRTYRSLLKARRVKIRILTLLNAFFLEQLINDDITPAQRTLQCQTMTSHYHRSATRVYHLFETFGTQQIMVTQILTLTMVKTLKSSEFQDLLCKAMEISV
ncbi:19617_t:CDS:1, partial [Funneliformis geosporum]